MRAGSRNFCRVLALVLVAASGCGASPRGGAQSGAKQNAGAQNSSAQDSSAQNSGGRRGADGESRAEVVSSGSPLLDRLVEAAIERTRHEVRYDPTYFRIPYPGGDVPAEVGVCTDEVIRSYRKLGIDLQREVHEDMRSNFRLYPRNWGLKRPDTNIDHRRVPNLRVFFARKGQSLPVTARAEDYRPGDIVTWDLGGGLTHIGIVVGVRAEASPARFQIVHNIGAGPKMEDVLFNWTITGHYRYTGPAAR
ncbi:MAG TPA: DUF1287 domain-containing protein [Pyrinomonadaceae bacterium]|nr:DUF1287 domain-containing protein [Pyrinomonadaceae bacterium]